MQTFGQKQCIFQLNKCIIREIMEQNKLINSGFSLSEVTNKLPEER